MKQKSFLIIILLFVLSIGLFGCSASESLSFKVSDAYITLDINPSVEIITDEEGLIAQVNALNEDAQVLLEGTNFVGQAVDVVIEEIIRLATELGYLDFDVDNAILVTVTSESDEDVTRIENKISEKVQEFVNERQIRINLIKTQFEDNEEILALAESLDISAGKVKLITYAMAFDETLTYEVGATMNIRDLNRIVMNSRNEAREFVGEEVQGAYAVLKEEQRQIYIEGRVTLFNDAIQAADSTLFTELLLDTTTTVEAVKALYQQYYEAVIAIETAEEEPVEAPTEEPVESFEEQMTALVEAREAVKVQLKNSFTQLLGQTLTSEERDTIIGEMQVFRNQYREFTDQIDALQRQNQNHFGVGIGGFFKEGMKNEVMAQFAAIHQSFVEQFAALGVELTDLESLFVSSLEETVGALTEEYKGQVAALKDEMKDQIDLVRDQIKEEHNLLKDAYEQGPHYQGSQSQGQGQDKSNGNGKK